MSTSPLVPVPRVAVLIDCDNVDPAIVEPAIRKAAAMGRLVFKRGYGTPETLHRKWKDVLVNHAFTPCLQYPYVSGKNTSDIALSLDALEALLDQRADVFVLVTSDSDFAYLCRKLSERGAVVFVVGDVKSPSALRKAAQEFFEWRAPQTVKQAAEPAPPPTAGPPRVLPPPKLATPIATPKVAATGKKTPALLREAVRHLAATTKGGKVDGNALMRYLKKTHPGFTPKTYGHGGLMKMVRSDAGLRYAAGASGVWTVSLAG